MKDIKAYLARVCSDGPLADQWVQLQQLYESRLWHELTLELIKFVKEEHFKQNGGLTDLYENFLSDFEHRINQLSLAELMLVIAEEITDYDKAVEFFTKTQEKMKNSKEGHILCMTAIGLLHLKAKKMDEAKVVIKEAQTLLDTLDGVTTVHGRFYDLSSNYSKITGSYNEYYRDALRFLGCMDISTIPEKELQERAFNLSLAALLGSDVYNFGELLAHEVLQYLKRTEFAWLIDVLYAFNSGNIQKFLDLKPSWSKQPDLAANETTMMQKITILCLMELTFKRKSTDRSFPFQLISEHTRLPVHEVELLVMKALSLGLIKGSIDEVNKMVHITWVQPRVLDKEQMQNLRGLLGNWSEKVKSSVYMVEDQVPELMVK
ncbi:26S proteasome non-ATPase regulatory subunit 13-like [Hydractinia symbiolongicarpus]|uniref:26S proteasome non-ATPase regulatory subunit 13-like n=1 Tax=Hydractinia symbiolongicarpus TaxID=13093 RepID=UPI00254D5350|nr:26S proteasome non-ATPase regulatory subunit 13-like [Hydractinia symbiolongicarpus]